MRRCVPPGLAVVVALSGLLAACTDADEDLPASADDPPAIDDDEDGRALLVPGRLTVCSDVPYPPFVYEDPDAPSGYGGFDIDLVREVAEGLGLEMAVRERGFEDLQSGAALNAGACDLVASAMTITPQREANVGFSTPYLHGQQSLIVLADADISGLAEVGDQRLGVQERTAGAALADEAAPAEVEVVEFDHVHEIHTALLAGQAVAGLGELSVNLGRVAADDRFEVVETFDTDEEYGFAIARDNEALIDAVNSQLDELVEDGTYHRLHERYFGIE